MKEVYTIVESSTTGSLYKVQDFWENPPSDLKEYFSQSYKTKLIEGEYKCCMCLKKDRIGFYYHTRLVNIYHPPWNDRITEKHDFIFCSRCGFFENLDGYLSAWNPVKY